jgi:hypothetical protein
MADTLSHRCTESLVVPPKAPLVMRVGVVGHRPNRLAKANLDLLRTRLGEVVAAIQQAAAHQFEAQRWLYADAPPVVRVISPLAEGVDRLFAAEGLALGCELTAVLPFEKSEFERDFAPPKAAEPNSVERFRELLGQAKRVFQLDGRRIDENRAYHIAGTVVLNQADLLVVVWDGERKNLRGGTEETFDDALERGVPVIWIDAHAPHHWWIVTESLRIERIEAGTRAAVTQSDSLERLRSLVHNLIDLPARAAAPHSHAVTAEDPQQAVKTYFHESRPGCNLAFWWKLFRDLVGDGKLRPPAVRVLPYESAVTPEWPRDQSTPVAAMIDRLRPFYAWPDKLADRYADGYRSAFVLAFFAAAFAVGMALGPTGLDFPLHGPGQLAFAFGELLAILLILYLVLRARWGQWHRRWLDYRLLAEMIRHERLVIHLGGQRAAPSVPEHWAAYGNLATSWMAWQARGVERAIGLPSATVDDAYLMNCAADLRRQLESQMAFHRVAAARASRIEHRLHVTDMAFFSATLVCCALHLVHGFWLHEAHIGHWLTFCCGFFPAVGAALAGIGNQGEFRRIAQRSKSMAERLEQQLEKLAAIEHRLQQPSPARPQLSTELAGLASEAAQTMVNEVLDWRIIFQDRPPRTA